MASNVRNLQPTDLLALVAHANSRFDNQAWTRERLGTLEAQPSLRVLRDQLRAFGRGRGAWVCLEKQRLLGLVSARRRGGSMAWEIDYLINETPGDSVPLSLLTLAVQGTGQEGAEKLFLRLEASSGLLTPVREAGFVPYQEEALLVRTGVPDAAPVGLRPATPSDNYPLFRLYNATTSEATRRYEAATYGEWHASQERRWLRNGSLFVFERDGVIHGSVRAARLSQGVMLDLTLDPQATPEAAGIVATATREVDSATETVLVLVPQVAEAVARRLEESGFSDRGEFTSLMHRTTRTLTVPKAIPAVAKNAIGV
jgi:hypothetical protein